MKISEQWLREWVNPTLNTQELSNLLTMSGLEIESVTPVATPFSQVVVAEVVRVEKHPEADRLSVCEVNVGQSANLTIVCGAKNVVAGMKTAAALEGAVLLNGELKIKQSKLRGVMSFGMLCSAKELGMTDESDGLIVLAADAPIGKAVWDYLHLNDNVVDVSITPNRGDCLSISGLAQEVAALTKTNITTLPITSIKEKIADKLTVKVAAKEGCPRYAGRVIRNVAVDAATPVWMQERLRRGGIRHISPIVDVMNYVMLELGQPMHAFDLNKISGDIHIRMAKANEKIELLDGQTLTVDPNTMLIADDKNPLAIAGVMGGLDSAVTLLTKHVFLESAFFQPTTVARMSRQYKLLSDSSYRFERGVDPTLQVRAIERATQLILEIAGGEPGPVIDVSDAASIPQQKKIAIRHARVTKLLGIDVSQTEIENIWQRLQFPAEKNKDGWVVTAPARRSDLTAEEDLIEEIARLNGYDKIPTHLPISGMQINPTLETKLPLILLRRALSDMGYQEVITYSFIDKNSQQLFDPESTAKELLNPMTAEMSVMRTTLWPGLVNTLSYNLNRQQTRAKIFESGLRFKMNGDNVTQEYVLSGLISGSATPEQWGLPLRKADFFDLKGDIENLLGFTFAKNEFEFKVGQHPALHPGQTAELMRNGQPVGILGALHPAVMQALDLQDKIYVFELSLEQINQAKLPQLIEISKFPEIRRDIAILIKQSIPLQAIQDTILEVAGDLLQDVKIFDVYQGKGISPQQKSIALALTLQHATRTLVEDEVTDLMDRVVGELKDRFAAELRG